MRSRASSRDVPRARTRCKGFFRASLCAALTLDELRDVAAAAGLAAARIYQSSDRHFTLEVAPA